MLRGKGGAMVAREGRREVNCKKLPGIRDRLKPFQTCWRTWQSMVLLMRCVDVWEMKGSYGG